MLITCSLIQDAFILFAIFFLIGKLNMDLVDFESKMPLLTLFLWRVEMLFQTRNICLSHILVHKTSIEEIYLFIHFFCFALDGFRFEGRCP